MAQALETFSYLIRLGDLALLGGMADEGGGEKRSDSGG